MRFTLIMLPNNQPKPVPVNCQLDLKNAVPIGFGTNNWDGLCRCHRCRIKTLGMMLEFSFAPRIARDSNAAQQKFGEHAVPHILKEARDRVDGQANAFRRN